VKEMRAFICCKRPRSVNAKGSKTFKRFIQEAYTKYCGEAPENNPVYSRIYYFSKVSHQLDADNLSKPIIDALEGYAFHDDLVVEFRQSGVVDLRKDDVSGFDISGMPDAVVDDFFQNVGTEEHLIYVEIGLLSKEMFQFGQPREVNQ